VTALREAGLTQFVEIVSEAGEPCLVKNPFPGREVTLLSAGSKRTLRGDVLEFGTDKGATYLLTPAGASASVRVRPTFKTRPPESSNWFGTKKIARF